MIEDPPKLKMTWFVMILTKRKMTAGDPWRLKVP
jgi:hypothetical protein